MKILPLVNTIKDDVAASGIHLKKATSDGIKIADRTAKIHNQSNLRKYVNIARCVSSNLIKNTTKEEIPYLAGALGMFIPFPLTSPILMGFGFLLRFSLPDKELDSDKGINETSRKCLNRIV